MTQPVTPGRIVLYALSDGDVAAIRERRSGAGMKPGQCNTVEVGEVYPAVVVRAWSGGYANLQVLLDGPDTHWVTSGSEGDRPGTWAWPTRA